MVYLSTDSYVVFADRETEKQAITCRVGRLAWRQRRWRWDSYRHRDDRSPRLSSDLCCTNTTTNLCSAMYKDNNSIITKQRKASREAIRLHELDELTHARTLTVCSKASPVLSVLWT